MENQRTPQQNKALHVYFQLLADEFNMAGLDMREVLKPGVEIPWSMETVKDYIWRPIQEIQLRKSSTTDLYKKEIDLVYETINRHIGEKFGVHVAFPSIEKDMFTSELSTPNS